MKKLLALLIATCLTPQLQAAIVTFAATTTNTSTAFPVAGTNVVLGLTYTPVVPMGGPVAVVTAATLTVGTETWSILTGTNELEILDNGAAFDNLQVSSQFDPSAPSGLGSGFAALSMTFFGNADLGGAPDATEANIGLLTASGTVATGTLVLTGAEVGGLSIVNFSGVATPEPTSMALLGGLALVGGIQVVRRRRRDSAEKTSAC